MDKIEGTGERIGGYRVVRRLATGGTSDVLLATAQGPEGFERSVVLKVLLSKFERDADQKAMFTREAAAYGRLSHPSVVRLYDFFANGDQLVLVLEYVDGPALSRLRGMLKTVGQQFDDRTALHIAACIFDALAAAHAAVDAAGDSAPVIHRDVSPSNVLMTWDGLVKLADFGVAKVTGLSPHSNAGIIKGTYGYMAPEQVKGEVVTPRADVYAGAIILWELLTKRRAFLRGALPEVEVLRELAEPRIVSIDVLRPDLDKSLRDAIKRALTPRVDQRTMTAEEMVATLRAIVSPREGREQLGRLLGRVRHEPQAATTMPPPSEFADEAATGRILALSQAPRPLAKAPRKTASYGSQPSGPTPRPPVLGPPRPRSLEKEMPASTLSPEEVALVMEASSAGPAPKPPPASLEDPGLASLLEPMSGRAIGDAIDEILREAPSSPRKSAIAKRPASKLVPEPEPAGIQDHTLVLGKLPPAPPTLEPLRRDLNATMVTPIAPTSRAMPSSFPQMNRTLAMYERVDVVNPTPAELVAAEKATQRPPQVSHATTAPMPAVPPPMLSPSTAKMRIFSLPPEAIGSVPPPPLGHASPAQTLPLAAPIPPPLPLGVQQRQGSQPQLPLQQVQQQQPTPRTVPASTPPTHVQASSRPSGEQRGSRDSTPYPSAPAPAPLRRSPVGVVFALLAVAGLASGAGAFGYVRWKKARVVATPAAAAAAGPIGVPSASATPSPLPSVSAMPGVGATPGASAMPGVSAMPSVSAMASGSTVAALPTGAPPSPSTSAPPSPSPSTSASAAGDVPPTMARITTTGTAPGRRIFVDERAVAQTPDAVLIKCGPHKIKLGSAGSTQLIDMPCGGEIAVGDR